MNIKTLNNSSLVDVVMVTFNHEKYIEQAITSVLSQKCAFTFRLLIGDDCSNDRTGEICRTYAEKYSGKIILVRNTTNTGLIRNYKRVFDLCQAKYVAILEGDDFWTDEKKLSKQIEILEKDSSVGLVYTGFNVLYESGILKRAYSVKVKAWKSSIYSLLLTGKMSKPASVTSCFRFDIMRENFNFDYFINSNFQTLDAPLWFEIAYHSKICFIPDTTACYRILNTSVSNNNNLLKQEAFRNTSIKTIQYYYKKHPIETHSEKECLTSRYCLLSELYLKHRVYTKAIITSKKMKLNKPKYIFIWLVAHYKFLIPLYNFYLFIMESFSKMKQKLFRAYLYFNIPQ